MSTETIIDLIRHGEPVGGQRLRGAQDDPLSALGWQQMRESVDYISHITQEMDQIDKEVESIERLKSLDQSR